MPNKRDLNLSKYNISKRRYRELYNFCLQYPEWIEALKINSDTIKSSSFSSMPSNRNSNTVDLTGELAVKRALLTEKCKMVEQTAIQADSSLYQWILEAVTQEDATYTYLSMRATSKIPCGLNEFTEVRKRFYYLLDKIKM